MDLTTRDKWLHFLAGEDVGPMVSPLCDDWSLDIPYAWPYDEPDPFPPGHRWHCISQQLAMAGLCGWDANILVWHDTTPPHLQPETVNTDINGGTRSEMRLETPYGELTCTTETKNTTHTVKEWLAEEEDFKKMAWMIREKAANYDEDELITAGQMIKKAVGGRGVVGIGTGQPVGQWRAMYYHLMDWPEAFAELHQAKLELALRQIETYRKAGYDFIFYCVDGTEWISPSFFRNWIFDDTKEIFRRWQGDGRFVLWHTCGQIKQLLEAGFYNELKPDVFETVSEPPVGNLPGLRWGRERLDPNIATKGNMPLNYLLYGPEEQIRKDVQRIKDETRGYRHIIGLSDDVLKQTPLAHCRAFVDEARKA